MSATTDGEGRGLTRRAFLAAGAAFLAAIAGGVRLARAGEALARDDRLPRIRTRPLVREDLYRPHDWAG